MIYDKLANREWYKGLPEVYAQLEALAKVKAEDVSAESRQVVLEAGKNYFTAFEAPTKTAQPPRLEVHHKAADIHCVFEGEEAIYVGDYEGTTPDGDYIAERDVAFFSGVKDSVIYLKPGEFLVVFPEEIHSPLNAGHGCPKVKKAVGKIFYK